MVDEVAKKYTLKQRMRDDFTKYFFAVLSMVPTLGQAATSVKMAGNENDAVTVVQKTNDSAEQSVEQTPVRVGNWTENQLSNSMMVDASYKRPSIKKFPDRADAFVNHSKVEWENMDNGALAVTLSDGSITMKLPNTERAAQTKSQASKNFLNGENAAQFAEFLHEVNHAKDIEYLNIGTWYQTPTNAVRFNNITENVSHCISYLALANFYQNAEKQGIETIIVDNQEKPLSYVLDNYPGLRQTYEKYGLDLTDTQSITRYVKLGIAYKNTAQDAYDAQCLGSYMSANEANKQKPWEDRVSEAKSEDKDFDEISHLMVSKCYIGLNTTVDLSSCYDLLNNMSKQDVYKLVEKESGGSEHVVSSENITAIDNYLTQQGIANGEKNDYIAAQFFAIIEKDENADVGLKNLMLQSQSLCENNNQARINYSDGTSKVVPVIDLTGRADKEVKTANFMLAYHNMSRGGR